MEKDSVFLKEELQRLLDGWEKLPTLSGERTLLPDAPLTIAIMTLIRNLLEFLAVRRLSMIDEFQLGDEYGVLGGNFRFVIVSKEEEKIGIKVNDDDVLSIGVLTLRGMIEEMGLEIIGDPDECKECAGG